MHTVHATDGDPSNYMVYFKRAAVYLAMGQAKKAIPDLDESIELKKDFHHVSETLIERFWEHVLCPFTDFFALHVWKDV